MPGRYQAVSQSLGGVGGPQEPRYSVDVPGAIDAFTTGASSLIRAAYERKRQAQLDQQAAAQTKFQNEQTVKDYTLREQIAKDSQANAQATHKLAVQKADRDFIIGGGILPHVEQQPTVEAPQIGTAEITPLNAPVVPRPAGPPRPAGSMPPVRAVTSPAPSPIRTALYGTQNATREVNVPEGFDPEKNLKYILGGQVIAGRLAQQDDQQAATAEQNRLKLAAADAMNRRTTDARVEVARIAATGSNAAGKAMTGTTKAGIFERFARGLLEDAHGDKDAAIAFLDTENGRKYLADLNALPGPDKFTPAYVVSAFGKYASEKTKSENVDTRQNVKIAADLVKGDTEGKPEEKTARAGATVKNIRNAVTSTTPPSAAELRARADTTAMTVTFKDWAAKHPRGTDAKGKKESDDDYYNRYRTANEPKKP